MLRIDDDVTFQRIIFPAAFRGKLRMSYDCMYEIYFSQKQARALVGGRAPWLGQAGGPGGHMT